MTKEIQKANDESVAGLVRVQLNKLSQQNSHDFCYPKFGIRASSSFLFVILCSDCSAQEDASEFRFWTTADGQRSGVRLKLVEHGEAVVRLMREDNDKVISISVEKLSVADKRFLASTSSRNGTTSSTADAAKSDDLTHFRSDHGASTETDLPTRWSDSQNIEWKTSLPGFGSSMPIFIGDRIYLTCYSGYGLSKESPGEKANLQRHLVCLSRDGGRVIWDKDVRPRQQQHDYQGFIALHGFASSTPASDGEQVYCLFGNSGVYAFDAGTGREFWDADVGHGRGGFGTSGSLVVHENLVIVNASSESGQMIALDKRTGKVAWRVDGVEEYYGTPVLVEANNRTEVVIDSKAKLISVDAASGELLWTCQGSTPPHYVCNTPIVVDDVIYAIHGHRGPVSALRPGGTGDVTDDRLWHCKVGNTVNSLVHHKGLLFNFIEEGGLMVYIDAKTGEMSPKKRMEPHPGLIYASPLIADDKIYVVSRENGTYVFSADREMKVLAVNKFDGDDSVFNASPVAHRGALFLRSDKYLYCIQKK